MVWKKKISSGKQSAKVLKKKNIKNHFDKSGKLCSVTLKNLPFSIKKSDIKTYFTKFGDISGIKLMRRNNGKLTGNGFIHFNKADAAEAAIEQCSGTDFMGRKVKLEWAKPISKRGHDMSINKCEINSSEPVKKEVDEDESSVESAEENSEEEEKVCVSNPKNENHVNGKTKSLYAKYPVLVTKLQAKEKLGRIIVRNLSFKVTEDKLQDHFKEFGDISEVVLLKNDDGKLVGCGFVQFQKKENANQAILARSGKKFLGRPIVCDWALPKVKYLKYVESEAKSKLENENLDGVTIKEEPCSEESETEIQIKSEDSDEEKGEEVEEEETEEEDEESDEMEDTDQVEEHFSSQRNATSNKDYRREDKRAKVISNDVSEGCTVFVKNIPFTATNEDLGKCMKQFGPVYYALICIDKLTEHSKGTGFVKFKNKDDAETCLQSSDLTIKDETIEVLRAVPRNDIKSLAERKKEKKVKDNRHLYLVKEGVILAGTPAAKDVSVADMEKRLKIEQWKTQMLRNLNMFISNTRLIIYNVPPTWTDKQVWQLFKEYAGPGAVINEARIMRDLRNVDANGIGKSKEFAFVHFTEHEHAIRALRSINNNPNIFRKGKRPIVTFSIENKAIHKIKQKRLQKSRMANTEKQNSSASSGGAELNKIRGFNPKQAHHEVKTQNIQSAEVQRNPFSGPKHKNRRFNLKQSYHKTRIQNFQSNEVHQNPFSGPKHKNRNFNPKQTHHKDKTQNMRYAEVEQNQFSGLESQPGSKTMRTKFKIKTQATEHMKHVKKDKQKHKLKMKIKNRNKKITQPQPKRNRVEENDSFTRLVDKYKSTLIAADSQKRWYE